MLDIRFLRENPELVKENIKKKFQDSKLPLVDEVIALDEQMRANKKEADDLRANRNKVSKSIGALMGQKKFEEAEAAKKLVSEQAEKLAACEALEAELESLRAAQADRLAKEQVEEAKVEAPVVEEAKVEAPAAEEPEADPAVEEPEAAPAVEEPEAAPAVEEPEAEAPAEEEAKAEEPQE